MGFSYLDVEWVGPVVDDNYKSTGEVKGE